MGHSCASLLRDTLLSDTLVDSCRTLLSDCVGQCSVGHSCGTLLWGTTKVSKSQPFCTRLPPKVILQVHKASISYETSSKGHPSILQNEHFVRDFLKNSYFESAKQVFHTRLPSKVTRQVSKTSISHETSSKTHTSKSPKRAFSSGKHHRSTHIKQPCQAFSRFQPLRTTPARTPIPMSQRHYVSTRLSRTKYCAAEAPHLATSRFPAPATKLALPHLKTPQSTALATKSDNIISCELQQNLHRTTPLG